MEAQADPAYLSYPAYPDHPGYPSVQIGEIGRMGWTVQISTLHRRTRRGQAVETEGTDTLWLEGATFAEAEAVVEAEVEARIAQRGMRWVTVEATAQQKGTGLFVASKISRTRSKGR